MSFSENCRRCSVKVDNGTGVLVSPNTEEYSYILTAKHNLYHDYENKKCTEPKLLDSIKLVAYDESIKLSLLKIYELDECDIDIAILKIKKVNTCVSKIKLDEPKNGQKYFLYGFPKHRRDDKYSKEEQIRNFELKVVDELSNHEIIVENDKYYSQSDIDGCSGGGVFENINEESFLVGIEFRMDSVGKKDDNNTRLRFISIKAFDEIVYKYNDELVYLDDTKNFNKKYNIEETLINLGNEKSIVIKAVPVEIDEVDSNGENKKKILNVSIYPVTFKEYELFCEDTARSIPDDEGLERGNKSVINVNWNDAMDYCTWLNTKKKVDGCKYRLPSIKEWEYIANKNLNKNDYSEKIGLLGICDMYGKLLEWTCRDKYLDKNEDTRIAKGSSYRKSRKYIYDVTKYEEFIPTEKNDEVTFRVIREDVI